MTRTSLLSVACAAALTVACGGDRDRAAGDDVNQPAAVGTAGEADRRGPTGADKDFANDVAVANLAEIELGQLASQRGVSADVKRFGQMMVKDHTMAGDEFKQVASQHSIVLPTSLDENHRELRDKLAKLQGAEFDREYISAMVDGHEDVADKLESRVDTDRVAGSAEHGGTGATKATETYRPQSSDNPATMALNQFAAKTLPTVKHHLAEAKAIMDKQGRRNTTE